MNYIKIMLTLFVAATAALAIVMRPARQAPAEVISPSRFDEALDRKIDSLDVKDVPAEAAVRIMHEKTGVDIHVDWDSFEKTPGGGGGVVVVGSGQPDAFPRSEHVTLSLSNVSLEEALTCLFKCNKDRSFYARGIGNRVEVLNQSLPVRQLRTVMYDVSDLLSDDYWRVKTPSGREDEVRKERMGNLLSILATCDWIRSLGGAFDPFAGRIIVTETDVGHRRVQQMLTWLRRMR